MSLAAQTDPTSNLHAHLRARSPVEENPENHVPETPDGGFAREHFAVSRAMWDAASKVSLFIRLPDKRRVRRLLLSRRKPADKPAARLLPSLARPDQPGFNAGQPIHAGEPATVAPAASQPGSSRWIEALSVQAGGQAVWSTVR